MRRDRGHLQRLSVLLELTSGLPLALSDAELDVTPPEGYVGLLLERFRRELILPNVNLLRGLRPLAVRPGMRFATASAAASLMAVSMR